MPQLLSRRTFAGLLAAAPLSRALAGGRGMFLSLNSVLLQARVPWPDFARMAAKIGFPGTDIMLRPAMEAGVNATNDLLSSLKIRPAVIDFPVEFRKDDATFKASLTQLEAAAQFAALIHCPRMITYIMPSSGTPRDEQRQIYKQRFTESARILAHHNVRLGLEFLGPLELRKAHKYEFVWRMNDMLTFARECGPNVGLLLDSWHWHHAGATTEDIVAAGRDGIVHVHFNDAPKLPPEQIHDDQRLLPGEGVINLTGFLQALQSIHYNDALSVEVFGRTKDMTPEAAAKAGLDSSLAIFRRARVRQG
jgi:sugar phosphate isomerase/epimerase